MYALINQTRVAFVALDRVTLIPFEMADRAIVKAVRRLADRFAPFTVHADWEETVTEHKAHSRADALSWASAYPQSAVVLIRDRKGRVISWRG
jgi:hypothetical protein